MSLYVTNYAKVLTTNSTAASFASKVPTTTAPSGAGVLTLPVTQIMPAQLSLIFYGTDADNETFKSRVIGWKLVGTLYIPILLAEVTCTLSATTGVAAATILNTEFFADTIVLTAGTPAGSSVVFSPTGELVAHLLVDLEGFSIVEITFDMNSSAASANALYALQGGTP